MAEVAAPPFAVVVVVDVDGDCGGGRRGRQSGGEGQSMRPLRGHRRAVV